MTEHSECGLLLSTGWHGWFCAEKCCGIKAVQRRKMDGTEQRKLSCSDHYSESREAVLCSRVTMLQKCTTDTHENMACDESENIGDFITLFQGDCEASFHIDIPFKCSD
ncbi:hypothetical protein BaRGS_00023457 [Batillaria attramentaria]|uniref:Uncharacterized protein n=1 Tax=Batillaria attramentaria TaxID=370345 RepID=A0ABD0KE41_9CAEN